MIYGIECAGNSLDVLKWSNKKEAERAGNSWLLIETEEDLAGSSISTKTLADLWNKHNPTETIKRFADRELGAKKVFPLLEKHAITLAELRKAQKRVPPHEHEEEDEMAATAKKAATGKKPAAKKAPAKKAPAKKGGADSIGRSPLLGKKLYAKKGIENPHREGGTGYNTFKIVSDNPGITYEDAIKKGAHTGYLSQQARRGQIEGK